VLLSFLPPSKKHEKYTHKLTFTARQLQPEAGSTTTTGTAKSHQSYVTKPQARGRELESELGGWHGIKHARRNAKLGTRAGRHRWLNRVFRREPQLRLHFLMSCLNCSCILNTISFKTAGSVHTTQCYNTKNHILYVCIHMLQKTDRVWMHCIFFFLSFFFMSIPPIPYSYGVEVFNFSLDLYTIGRTLRISDRPIARPLSKYRTTQRTINTHAPNIHALSGIRTHDHSVRASEDSS
jgi:hypothetical protein